MEILDAIKPRNTRDAIGNRTAIRKLQDILKDPGHSPRVIALVGPVGCGKSLICNLTFRELDLKAYDVSTKETLQIATSFIVNKTIECYTERDRRKILYVDNVDILLQTERNAMSLIDSCIPDLIRNQTFMILTCRPVEEKSITNVLKKNVEVIKLSYPTVKDTFVYLSTKLEEEGIEIEDDKLLEVVKKYRGNVRDVVLNLRQSANEMEEVVTDRGYKEYNPFEVVSSFLLDHSWKSVNAILNHDPSVISYLLYENALDDIYNNRDAKETMNSYSTMVSYMVQANVLERFMVENLDWSVYPAVQIVKIGGIYIALKDLKRKASRKDTKFRFSQVLSKVSHKNIMYKKFSGLPMSCWDAITLIDAGAIKFTGDYKQISSTYNKYFG